MELQPVLLGTSNAGKLRELSAIASGFGYNLLSLHDVGHRKRVDAVGPIPEVGEGGITYEENARSKALAYADWSGMQRVIADDTGLEIDALGGLPGVYTAGVGTERTFELLGPGRRTPATFVSVLCYVERVGSDIDFTAPRVIFARGSLRGEFRVPQECATPRKLHSAPHHPLPFSPYFFPNGYSTSLEELSGRSGGSTADATTSFLSHRGLAFSALMKML